MTERAAPLDWLRGRLRDAWASRDARWLIAIMVVALALRVAWVLYATRVPLNLHDPTFYLIFGGQIAQGHGYHLPNGDPTAYYPIGYPAALGSVLWLVLHTPIPDKLPQAAAFFNVFLGVATLPLIYVVGRWLFNSTVGLLSAAWLALFPNLIFHTGTILSETLFNFLIMAGLAILFWSAWPRGRLDWPRVLAFGVVLGLAALVRPIALLFLPLLFVVWLWAGAGWRAVGQTAAVLAVTAAVIAPWSIRNVVVMHSPILISANLGDDLCMGHHPGARGAFALPDYCFAGYDQYKRPEYEVRRNDENIRKAVRFAVHHPGAEVKLLSRKAHFLWEHDHDGIWAVESYGDDPFIDPQLRSMLARTADIFFFATISIGGLGLLGFVLAPRDPRRVFTLLGLLAFAGIPLAFFGDARFHVPVMPLISIAAAWAVVTAIRGAPRFAPQMGSGVEVAEGERPVPDQDALQDA